jgi:HlyD family secretion protein
MKRKVWLTAAMLILAGAGSLVLRKAGEPVRWRTAKVDRGDITQRVVATGTINALIQVPVGTQVSGVVTSLSADFSSLVKKGQVIAQIDPTPWRIALDAAQAGLEQATVTSANAETVYRRNLALWKARLVSDNDLDAVDTARKVALAGLKAARSTLATARTNLGYCTIRAPVDGVVVARLVDVGQTVAASYATPNLFIIAQDLSRLKAQVAIDEADIGQVRVGQPASFTVESYPDTQFRGVVSEVQLNPVVTNNVVTYNVVMEVDNQARPGEDATASSAGELERTTARYMPPGSPVYRGDLALFPGMTADCSIVTRRRQKVLRVPAAALRFDPAPFQPPESDDTVRPGLHGWAPNAAHAATPGQPGRSSQVGVPGRGQVAERAERVWVLEDGRPRAVPVETGATDEQYIEVKGDGVVDGMAVLTGADDYRKPAALGGQPLLGGARR